MPTPRRSARRSPTNSISWSAKRKLFVRRHTTNRPSIEGIAKHDSSGNFAGRKALLFDRVVDHAGTLRVSREHELGAGAASEDGIGERLHVGPPCCAAVCVAGGVGRVVHALKREGTGAEVGEELAEHGRSGNGADIATLAGAAGEDHG